jgi:hypothetical protein
MFGRGMSAGALEKIKTQNGNEFLWARRAGHVYVSHDQAVIAEARAAIGPRLTRAEQERRLARVVDAAIRRNVARGIE